MFRVQTWKNLENLENRAFLKSQESQGKNLFFPQCQGKVKGKKIYIIMFKICFIDLNTVKHSIMSNKDTYFQDSWLELEEFQDWLVGGKEIKQAKCSRCHKTIELSNMGIQALNVTQLERSILRFQKKYHVF